MLDTVICKVFGTKHEREVKRMRPVVDEINALEPRMETLTDEQLKAKTDEFRRKLDDGASLDDLFPSGLAIIRNDTVRHRMPAGLSSDLRVEGTLSTGSLIYEIAVPISRSALDETARAQEHGLLGSLGPAVSIGLETPDPEDDENRFDESSGIPSVTEGGGGRRSPRGRRGRRGRRGDPQQRQQPPPTRDTPRLDLWTRVVTEGQ